MKPKKFNKVLKVHYLQFNDVDYFSKTDFFIEMMKDILKHTRHIMTVKNNATMSQQRNEKFATASDWVYKYERAVLPNGG